MFTCLTADLKCGSQVLKCSGNQEIQQPTTVFHAPFDRLTSTACSYHGNITRCVHSFRELLIPLLVSSPSSVVYIHRNLSMNYNLRAAYERRPISYLLIFARLHLVVVVWIALVLLSALVLSAALSQATHTHLVSDDEFCSLQSDRFQRQSTGSRGG